MTFCRKGVVEERVSHRFGAHFERRLRKGVQG